MILFLVASLMIAHSLLQGVLPVTYDRANSMPRLIFRFLEIN